MWARTVESRRRPREGKFSQDDEDHESVRFNTFSSTRSNANPVPPLKQSISRHNRVVNFQFENSVKTSFADALKGLWPLDLSLVLMTDLTEPHTKSEKKEN